MARRFPVGGAARARVPRRKTTWIGPAVQGFVSVASGGATLLNSLINSEPETLVRIRGMVTIAPTVVSADVSIVGAVGMGLVSEEAFAAGIASIPEPFTDADWGGWVMWRSFSYKFEFADATGVNFPNWSFEVDSKAMRKATANERLVTIAESQSGAFDISTPLRALTMLH